MSGLRQGGRTPTAPNIAVEPTPAASARPSLRQLARLTAGVRCTEHTMLSIVYKNGSTTGKMQMSTLQWRRMRSMVKVIAILEDDPGRTNAMTEGLVQRLPIAEAIFFDNAPDMVAWLASNLGQVCLLCLDHDLGPNRQRDGRKFDPGIGRDVVDFLVTQPPACAVLVHSANSERAEGMVCALQDAGWSVERVIPVADLAWVKTRWLERVVSSLVEIRGGAGGRLTPPHHAVEQDISLRSRPVSRTHAHEESTMHFIRPNLAVCGFHHIRRQEQFQQYGFHAQLQCAAPFDPWLAECVEVKALPLYDAAPMPSGIFWEAQAWLARHWDHGNRLLVS